MVGHDPARRSLFATASLFGQSKPPDHVKQSIGKDTLPKVIELAFPRMPCKWHEQDGYFSLGNGSEIWLAGLDDKERVDKVLGREFSTLYFNEASEIPLSSYMVALTRLAQQVRQADGRMLPRKC